MPQLEDPITSSLADQLRLTMHLTSAPEDQVLMELAGEIDRHAEILLGTVSKDKTLPLAPALRSQISDRRGKLLVQLLHCLHERSERMNQNTAAKMGAAMIRMVSEVLIEQGMEPRQVQTTIMLVADKLDRGSPGGVTRQRKSGD